MDGAGAWSKFMNVTLPLLAPTTFYVVTTAVINALQVFEQVYVLIPTEPPGGPANSTMTIVSVPVSKGFPTLPAGVCFSCGVGVVPVDFHCDTGAVPPAEQDKRRILTGG